MAAFSQTLISTGANTGAQLTGGVGGVVFKTAGAGAAAGLSASVAGAAFGSAATLGAATFGIGAVIGVGLLLWAKHKARLAGATSENHAMNIIMPGFINVIQVIFHQLNAGQITPQTAVQALSELEGQVKSAMEPYTHAPGQSTKPCPVPNGDYFQSAGLDPKSKTCTAGCFLYCGFVEPVLINSTKLIVGPTPTSKGALGYAGAGMITFPPTSHSKYGYVGTPSFVVNYVNANVPITPGPKPGGPPTGGGGNIAVASPVKNNLTPVLLASGLIAAKIVGFL